ncbi:MULTISPECIES: tol-pal system protein YbgF [Shewanella]|jgi:tol-pal system protein YbgF|uniref:Cell division coordinator CpoB n=1 Tax=Shewanella baltica (strain OS155 / ATCC BAA-1091) TaxID=325240 RepID=A3D3E4_SHEB5|nr:MULTISPECIES: tol-pal system protein YbgF [Shewanella]MBO6227129.1 tol-pal system protein YbgF [Shewanella sp.]ABN61257.1 Tetratricopeptide TPR_2 repeat protein [Shewanella baltica OS155]ABS07887.1 Tol-Pal system YbgF [Shewanella baltica OS185]ACK47030.1 tol-pal system protein YbgF [Shewanella baltica OS223]AEH13610.1 tol-pal system protein YbgF [Shewanella baltica OS117]
MKRAVLITAMFLGAGAAVAAPAPVEDIAGGSGDDRLARIERIVKSRQQSELDMQRRLDTLQQEVLDLRGLTEQQNYQIEQMQQRQRQLYDELANLSSKASAAPAAAAATSTPSVASTNAASSSLSETASYESAVNLVLKERKYDDAIPAFRAFIKQYPDSVYAANANYWLGQLLFNKSEFAEAKQAFKTVVDRFSDSNKRGDSLVKLGMIAEKTGDKAGATQYYQQVVKDYANSAAARIAQQQLAAIKA